MTPELWNPGGPSARPLVAGGIREIAVLRVGLGLGPPPEQGIFFTRSELKVQDRGGSRAPPGRIIGTAVKWTDPEQDQAPRAS